MLGLGTGFYKIGGDVYLGGYNNTCSVSFDGTDDYIDLEDTFQDEIRNSFSISFWINTGTWSGNNRMILGSTDSGNENYMYIYTAAGGSAGKLAFGFKSNNAASPLRQLATNVTFSAESEEGAGDGGTSGAWWHFALTYAQGSGGGTGTAILYKNGSVLASGASGSVTGTNQDSFTASDNVYLGGRNNAGTLDGQIAMKLDDIAIFNAVLDADAVAAIYNSGEATDLLVDDGDYDNSGDLVSYYKLNECSGTTATDAKGHSNGTLENGAAYITDAP